MGPVSLVRGRYRGTGSRRARELCHRGRDTKRFAFVEGVGVWARSGEAQPPPVNMVLKKGPIGMQLHQATAIMEHNDIRVEVDHTEDTFVTVK